MKRIITPWQQKKLRILTHLEANGDTDVLRVARFINEYEGGSYKAGVDKRRSTIQFDLNEPVQDLLLKFKGTSPRILLKAITQLQISVDLTDTDKARSAIH